MTRNASPPGLLEGDPLLARMAGDKNALKTTVLDPLVQSIRDVRHLRDEIVSQTPPQIAEPILAKVDKIIGDLWKTHSNTGRFRRLLDIQGRKVQARLAKVAAPQGSGVEAKSSARQQAGKQKTASLVAWRGDFSAARQALKEEGYTGSFKLNKEGAFYQKIQSIRQARLLSLAVAPKAVAKPKGAPKAVAKTKGAPKALTKRKGAPKAVALASGRKRLRVKRNGEVE